MIEGNIFTFWPQGNHNLKKNRDDDVAFLGPLRRVTLDFLPRVLGMGECLLGPLRQW